MPIDIPGPAEMMVTCHLVFEASPKARGEKPRLIVMSLTNQKLGVRGTKIMLKIYNLFVEH
jgi:hypothetical protein